MTTTTRGGHADVINICLRIGRRMAERSDLPVESAIYERDTTLGARMGGATTGTACGEYGRVKGYRNHRGGAVHPTNSLK